MITDRQLHASTVASMLIELRCKRREVQIENKIARREVAKAREASPELTHLPGGGDVMGGGDSFQAARARYMSSHAASACVDSSKI